MTLGSAFARAAGDAKIVSPHHQWMTKQAIDEAHRAGLRVVPYTLNTPQDWERAVALGVDGIITDDPAALLRWLGR